MANRETGTEQLIKDTARRIFLIEGKLHATTADIAKEAGIPRTSVHYYFRSRDILFRQVFDEALKDLTNRLNDVLESKLSFKVKIENFVTVVTEETLLYPYLETFVVTEIISQQFILPDKSMPEKWSVFVIEVKKEMEKGIIHEMDPLQFILNLFALMAYPAISAPLYTKLFNISDARFRELLEGRKEVILKLIFK
ncbi:MAG TPA: TetR/AcrR family transcriptional regulator [Chryseolinea sp.]|nr:TetR/AcrR family transcriptional regulator [Chryseolinea sp.]